ncbi:MAG: hypothetical protein Kow00108_17540 [Calditrichia bacterium]
MCYVAIYISIGTMAASGSLYINGNSSNHSPRIVIMVFGFYLNMAWYHVIFCGIMAKKIN